MTAVAVSAAALLFLHNCNELQSSQPESSVNYYDEYNINTYDTVIAYLTGH